MEGCAKKNNKHSPMEKGLTFGQKCEIHVAGRACPQGLVWGSCSQAVASCAAALAYACVGSYSTANAIPRSPDANLDLDPT